MKLRDRDEPLDPQVERELEAVDRALAGDPVDPDLKDLGELALLLRDERPEAVPGWATELDERAAAGFRDRGSSSSPLAALERFRLRGVLAPAGALATAAVIAIVGVSTLSESTDDSGDAMTATSDVTSTQSSDDSAGSGDALSADPEQSGYSEEIAPLDSRIVSPAIQASGDEIAPGTDKRQIERDVALSLSTRPEKVREVSDEAIAITRSLDGIIASSQVSESGNQSSATLQLTLPSRNLDTALDRLTELANVKSLDEATVDITKPFVSAQDRLRDLEAERRSLLQALANASTEAEADALRLQIADARRQISQAEAAFENIARRSRLSDISLTIVGDPNIDEDRTIGDWWDDAVSVLRDVAGVLLISAAILIPLGIVAGLGWWIVSTLRRRRRERALD